MSVTTRVHRAIDGSEGGRRLTAFVARFRRRTSPRHWTDIFGIATVASIVVLLLTGVVLMFFYTPSSERVIYEGGYLPLHGVEVSKAFESTLALSLDVRGGLLIRQAHHWAALLLPAAVIGQLVVAFFTGAFRRPRQWAWVLLFLSLIAALAAGWSGYALPDDMLSGTGLRIVEGIVLGIPVMGTWIATLVFGGGFPGRIIENLYPIHLLVSAALVVLVAARVRVLWVHGRQRMPGPIAQTVSPLPVAARRAAGLFGLVCGVLLLIAATVTVSPIWLYGPSDPANASAGSQPDWYTGFLDGALRLVPPGWEIELGGFTLTLAVLVPLAVVGLFLGAVLLYPFVENWASRRRGVDAVLDRPRDVPVRTGIGVAGATFYAVLWGAASADLIAVAFRVSLEGVLTTFQVLLLVGPAAAFVVARAICLGLQRADRELLAHGYETGRIVRLPGGEYVEVHAPLPDAARERIAGADREVPIALRPDRRGRLGIARRLRAAVSRRLFRDRLAPVTGTIATRPDQDEHAAA